MKRLLPSSLLLSLTLSALIPFQAVAEEAINLPESKAPTVTPFARFDLFDLPYSPTFGLALWSSAGAELEEYTDHRLEYREPPAGVSEEDWRKTLVEEVTKRYGKEPLKLEAELEKLRGQVIYDPGELGSNTRLNFKNDKGSAVLLRIRDKFQLYNEETDAATFSYLEDRVGDTTSSALKGALMLDFYQDWLYNRPLERKSWWIQAPYRFSLRLAAEIDRSDLDPENETDLQRYYALATFQANPDQNARFLFKKGLEITSPQFVQAGMVLERNLLSDEDSFHWILGWEPRFQVDTKKYPLLRYLKLNNRMYLNDGFTFKKREEEAPGEAAGGAGAEQKSDFNFVFINPRIALAGSSEARVNLPDVSDVDTLDELEALKEEVVKWEVETGFGFKDDLFKVAWHLHGIHPLADLGESHLWHELKAEFNFVQIYRKLNGTPEVAAGGKQPKAATTPPWAGFTGFISWTQGEAPPHFSDTDLISIGASIRF